MRLLRSLRSLAMTVSGSVPVIFLFKKGIFIFF